MKNTTNKKPTRYPCWVVFMTCTWWRNIEERQWSSSLPKEEAKECISLLRRLEKKHPTGKRYRLRKLTDIKTKEKSKKKAKIITKYHPDLFPDFKGDS